MQAVAPALRRQARILAAAVTLAVAAPPVVFAQAQDPPTVAPAGEPGSPGQVAPVEAAPPAQPSAPAPPERALGVLPSFLTSNGAPGGQPLSARSKFGLAIRTSFDPSMYPLVGVIAAVSRSYGPGLEGYGRQYAASFTDNVAGNLLTSGALPAAFGQDPRYYRRGTGTARARAAYAASRVFVAYGDDGRSRFNAAEVIGATGAATLSNLYYPRDRRGAADTVGRLGYQLLWDALANELQEFWPDISRKLRRRKH